MATTTHDSITDRRLEPRRLLPRRPIADAHDLMRDDPRYAYLEWLRMEARILQLELFPDLDPTRDFTPCNTFAKSFHFPTGVDWRKVPKPSTRAAKVLAAVGVTA
ncbi:hypothetical protein WMC41_09930 [Shinella yambaruensis]|uniref:hypothetical protein n=1 Tax=Shinella yambaruensis TaxID=415996 RepID=UPI003D79792F